MFAQRITFVGELGWELYASAEFGLTLWDLLWEAGREHGLVGGGYRAIDSMRLEKGYRVWGAGHHARDHAGRGRAVVRRGHGQGGRVHRPRRAGRRPRRATGRRSGCAAWCWTTRASVCLGSEPVRVDGVAASGASPRAASATGSSASIAFAYLPAAVEEGARVDVAVFGEWVGAEVVAEPLYDPGFERVRG